MLALLLLPPPLRTLCGRRLGGIYEPWIRTPMDPNQFRKQALASANPSTATPDVFLSLLMFPFHHAFSSLARLEVPGWFFLGNRPARIFCYKSSARLDPARNPALCVTGSILGSTPHSCRCCRRCHRCLCIFTPCFPLLVLVFPAAFCCQTRGSPTRPRYCTIFA